MRILKNYTFDICSMTMSGMCTYVPGGNVASGESCSFLLRMHEKGGGGTKVDKHTAILFTTESDGGGDVHENSRGDGP